MGAAYGQFCPIALGAEVFAERWTPLLLRELLNGSFHFTELQRGVPKMSRNLLTQRLEHLVRAGVVRRTPNSTGQGFEYHLTRAGEELRPVVMALGAWGYRWVATEIRAENLDPDLLMWFLRRRVRSEHLPAVAIVTRFEFRGSHRHREFWLILQRPAADLCLRDPGFRVDVEVLADVRSLAEVYLGHRSLASALRSGGVQMSGRRDARDTVIECLGVSPFAPAETHAAAISTRQAGSGAAPR